MPLLEIPSQNKYLLSAFAVPGTEARTVTLKGQDSNACSSSHLLCHQGVMSHRFCCHLLSGSYYVPSTVLLVYIHCYFIFTAALLGDMC